MTVARDRPPPRPPQTPNIGLPETKGRQPTTPEKDWQRDIVRLAQTLGWRVAHFRPARTNHGWRTAVGADGAGFPDLVLARDRVIFVGFKTETGRMSEQQLEWKAALEVAGAEHYVWRPDDLDQAMKVLLDRRRAVA